ncbi:MAG: LLM class F420-dependent oxidoreductase [Chloroflexota bacterium]|nr:MAG: LLM class F420-dependent oxidoreductase [Chloroflexota bacterium]
MKIGLHCNNFTWPGGNATMGATLGSLARRCEAAGFYSFDVMDHFFQIGGPEHAEREMNEAYTTLGFIAGVTERMKLGTVVTGVTYREPGFLVKQVTSLDVLSGGRAWFGIGAAWFEREHLGLGFAFPPIKERFERLEETLQIARQMWSGEVKAYAGKHYRLAETLCSPMPVQEGGPPVMIGGAGERKTLRLVARYASACNIGAPDSDTMRHKLDILREHCQTEGRSYDAIEKTTNTNMLVRADGVNGAETPAQLVARLRELRALGMTWVIGRIANAHEPGVIEMIGREVVPAVAEL